MITTSGRIAVRTCWRRCGVGCSGARAARSRPCRRPQDPTASIQAVPDALAVAESLLGSAPLVCGAYWSAVTVRPLAALLYAAGPNGDGGGIGWVNLAVENVDTGTTTPGWDRAAEICGCADDPAAAGLARAVRGAAAMSSRQRFSI